MPEFFMTKLSWIRNLFARPVVRPFRRRPFRARPTLEVLEDRWVPSTTKTPVIFHGPIPQGNTVANPPTSDPTWTVNSTGDTGAGAGFFGDLRYCINQANATGGAETINFDPGVFATAQTITLSMGQLELTDTTGTEQIIGPSAGVTVSGNNASRVFQVDALVTASISGLTISGGNAGFNIGGGLSNFGSTTLTNCTVSGNYAFYFGGGVSNRGGSVTLTNCTVSGNSVFLGGSALYGSGSGSSLALTNCTISGNHAGYGAVYTRNNGAASLTNCTVSGNSGNEFQLCGGVYSGFGYSTITLQNTIVAGNTTNDVGIFGGGTLVSNGNNLIGNTSGLSFLFIGSDLTGTSAHPLNAVLAPLSNYGGTTQTVALLPGSPAIDAGASGAGIPATDQRGVGRVGAVDIGAFESRGFTMALVAGSTPQTAQILTPFANPLAVTLTPNNPMEPVDGGIVSFVANPSSGGATAILVTPSAVISGGQASTVAGPNNAVGTYTVFASANGASPSSVTFALTNTGPALPSLVVDTTSGVLFPGAGLLSLTEAVAFANLDSAGISSITFDPTVFATPQTITLTGSQLELSNTSETESITGPAAGVTVNGNNTSRVFQVDSLVNASISGLTISGGNPGADIGGGLNNLGTLMLTNCTVSGNSAFNGGGVDNSGTATLTNCTVSSNSARIGGGIENIGGTLTVSNSTLSGNSSRFVGGGIRNLLGTVTVSNSTLSGNSGGNRSGGIDNVLGTLTVSNSTLSGNSARAIGGIFNLRGAATVTGSTLSGNSATFFSGGGIFNSFLGTLTVTGSTLSGNSAGFDGGGIFNFFNATANLTNCTLSGNSTTRSGSGLGGGLFNRGTTTLANCTVSGNSAAGNGGGLFTSSYSTTNLTNSTVSGNSATGNGGGLYNFGGNETLTACTVSGNSAVNGAGAFTRGRITVQYVYGQGYSLGPPQYGTTNLSNCTVSGNAASGNGGGLDTSGFGIANLTNCTVSGNSAVNGGGASSQGFTGSVYLYGKGYVSYTANGATNVTNCTVSGNSATGSGGGLDNASLSTATVTGTNVKKNSASVGGGIANQGTLTVDSSNIINNTATSAGGGISTTGGSATITNSVINTNQVNSAGTAVGGGIDCESSTLSLTNCTVNANQANGINAYGGGIYALNSMVTLQSCTVNGNKANGSVEGEGGGIYSFNSVLNLLNTTVKGNKATTAFNNIFEGP
jgi:hypothetical protein